MSTFFPKAVLLSGLIFASPHVFAREMIPLYDQSPELMFFSGQVIHQQRYGDGDRISYVVFTGCQKSTEQVIITTYANMNIRGSDFPLASTFTVGVGDSFSFFMFDENSNGRIASKSVQVVSIEDAGFAACELVLQPAL